MKFGAHFANQSVPEWSAHNILYDELKQDIRNVTTGRKPASQEQKKALLQFFNDEFENTALFVKSKLGEVDHRVARCQDLVEALATGQPVRTQFEHEISRTTRDLQSLARYIKAQYTAFRKLIKKYKKWANNDSSLDVFQQKLEGEESFARVDMTPRFLELSALWDMARDGRFEALHSLKGSDGFVDYNAADRLVKFDTNFAIQSRGLTVWIPMDNVMEVKLSLLPKMRLMEPLGSSGADDKTIIYFDTAQYDYARGSQTPGQIHQACARGQESSQIFCAPTGGLRGFTVTRVTPQQAEILCGGRSFEVSGDDSMRMAINWVAARHAHASSVVHSHRTRYEVNIEAESVMVDPQRIFAVIDQDITLRSYDGKRHAAFPHAVLDLRWTGYNAPDIVQEVVESHLVYPVSSSFSISTMAAFYLNPDIFIGSPSWLEVLRSNKDIHRAPQIQRNPSRIGDSKDTRDLRRQPSTSILLNSDAPDLVFSDDQDETNGSPTTFRYWNEFDHPEEDGEGFAVFLDSEEGGYQRAKLADQLANPILRFSRRLKLSVEKLRNLLGVSTAESRDDNSSIGSESDPLLPDRYSPRLSAQPGIDDSEEYEFFPRYSAQHIYRRDAIMAMLSFACFTIAGLVTTLALSIIFGGDSAIGLPMSVRIVIIVGLLFGVAFGALGMAIMSLQSTPSWFGQFLSQSLMFLIVCAGAGGIAWIIAT